MSGTAICFFSGTGNSFDIALRLSGLLERADVYNLATMRDFACLDGRDRVGIVCPVYGFRLPNIVRAFIERMPYQKDKYHFIVLVPGSFSLGAEYRAKEAFAEAGKRLDYAACVHMPQNYILFSMVPSQKVITSKTSYSCMLKYKDTAKSFTVGAGCTGCGRCKNLCQSGNIQMVGNRPVFGGNCECCLACVHACPVKAINYGEATVNKKRYINPNVKSWKT